MLQVWGQHGSTDNLQKSGFNPPVKKAFEKHNWYLHTSKDLVTSFTAENHFHTHGLDFTAEQIHGGTCTNSCHIICLEVVDDFGDSVQTFLDSEYIFVMDSAQEVRSLPGSKEIGRVLQTNREGMQLRPSSQCG